MGTKRPSWTLFDTLMNMSMSDHKLQPGGKVSRDPSPRPAMTVRSEQESDGLREENWRKENEAEKMKDKTRYRDMDAPDRYCEGDRSLGPRSREGEREMWERDRRKEDGRSRNGKLLLNVEKETDRELERRAKKSGTFPRFKKAVASPDIRLMSVTEMGTERRERRQKDRPKRAETDAWEQEKEWAWQRERERDEVRSRGKEEGKTTGRRYMELEKVRQRERYQESDIRFQDSRREGADSWDRRERMREKPMPDIGERVVRMAFPHRRKDIKNYADRKESENAQRREKRRDIRIEGDDEREPRRERVRGRDGEELMYQYSKSEGDNMGKTARERDRERQRYRARDREREVDRARGERAEDDHKQYRDGDRRAARPADREGKESWRDLDNRGDRKEDDRYREYKDGRNGKRMERQADTSRVDRTGRISRSPTEQAPRVPPRTQSSGEWSSDPDSEMKYRRDRGRYEEQESRREGTFEREKDRERQSDQERTADKRQIRNERQESDKGEKTGSMPEQRRMWLEPQRGKNSKGTFIDDERHTGWKEQRGEEETSMESQAERGGDGWRMKEEPDERCLEQSSYKRSQGGRNEYREDTEREQEGVSVDEENVGEIWRDKGEKEHLSDNDGGIEESSQRDEEGGVIDDLEEKDREVEGGSDYWARSESEGGSEAGWTKERDEMLSPEDGFVTLSSGGEDEREDTEEQFRDCQEFQEVGAQSPAGFKGYERDQKREEERTMVDEETADGEEKQPKYVFVVGKALPQSQNNKISPCQSDQIGGVEINDPDLETHHHLSGNATRQPQDDLHQTLNRNDEHPMINNQDTESEHKVQREERLSTGEAAEGNIQSRAPSDVHHAESREEMRSKVKHLYYEMGIVKRDSKTERLLKEWRVKNKELTGKEGVPASLSQSDLDRLQPILDQINTGALSPEEVEAIRIRLSGTWSMSEEPKRRSQAPHLRWAKDVVREILGHSEEEPSTAPLDDQPAVNQSEISNAKQQEEVAEETREVPVIKLSMEEEDLEPELEELFDVRGMGQSQAHMHADQFTVMHVVTHTHTHADTALDSERKEDHSVDKKTYEPSGQVQLGESDIKVTISEAGDNEANLMGGEKGKEEEEMYLNADNTLYKPNSCPILYYDPDSELLCPSSEGESQGVEYGKDESEQRRQGEEPEETGTAVEVTKIVVTEPTEGEGGVEAQRQVENLPSSCSLGDLGSKARSQRRGLRKTTRRSGDVEEDEEGVGRDRRTRIFYATDDEEDRSKSWGEVGLRALLGTFEKRRKNSKFFNAAQLYQQYSEAAQNFEILRQARSETLSVCEDTTSSPLPSPPPARRPLPPVPPQTYSNSLSHTGSIQSLPLPERPRGERRASSPRLSISQSSSLWRDLPGVRDSAELVELTDDQRRLQEVRFEVVTSEASYCRSLEIVVTHFVKSKHLGVLLTTQERNWLFSRLVDVRAISHSFLSKLEERVESDVMHFTVCDIINAQCPLFRKAYVPYLTNQSYQDATYQRLMNENPRFKMVVEKIERSSVCERLPLRSFLVLPFQRITRLKLLVQNIVKRTTPGTEEATQAIKALKHLEKIIQEGNDSITQMKSIESLVSLNSKVDFECRTLPLISQSRRLVREGPVTELMEFSLKETERHVYLHLFTDYLLLSLPKEGGRFTVIDHCPVSELRAENCRVKLHSIQNNLFRLHMTQKPLLLRTDAPSDKLRWISAISRPHPEIDFSAAQDFEQMQCIRAFVAQQPDELSLEKAEIILVHQESSDHWVEGTRLSDRQRGWVPKAHLETIMSSRVKNRNLLDALKLTAATATAGV